jgi:hypothetical protein
MHNPRTALEQPVTLRDRYTRRDIQRTALRAARGAVCRECLAAAAPPPDAAPPKGRPRLIGWAILFLRPYVELVAYTRCPAGHVDTAYVPL